MIMKTILVTGASGLLGSHLVARLLQKGGTKIIAVLGRPEDKANLLPQSELISVFPCSELFTTDFGHIDTLIHTAFSRGENLAGLTASIELTEKVIELVNGQDIDSLVNISSQGLYLGLKPGQKVTEDGTVGPNTAYGLAKWAVENMLHVGCQKPYTNMRMASLGTNARFLDFFVDSVIRHQGIKVTAPNQFASIMDVDDAVEGILSVLQLPIQQRNTVYNLGPGVQHSILDYAKIANEVGVSYGFLPTEISVQDAGSDFAICMDCSRLEAQTGWKPKVTETMMLKKMFDNKC